MDAKEILDLWTDKGTEHFKDTQTMMNIQTFTLIEILARLEQLLIVTRGK
jgi:hypothetical protein